MKKASWGTFTPTENIDTISFEHGLSVVPNFCLITLFTGWTIDELAVHTRSYFFYYDNFGYSHKKEANFYGSYYKPNIGLRYLVDESSSCGKDDHISMDDKQVVCGPWTMQIKAGVGSAFFQKDKPYTWICAVID